MDRRQNTSRPSETREGQQQNHAYQTIRRKILTSILVPSCFPLILVSAVILHQFYTSYTAKVQDHLAALVQKHTQNIDTFLQERLSDIETLSTESLLNDLQDSTRLQQELANLQRVYGNLFVDLGLVAESGRQVTYAGPYELEGADYSQAEWFQQATKKETTISDVFLGKRGYPHFIVTVRRIQGGEEWILRSTIDFGAFTSLVQNIRIGQTGFAFIINTQGELQTQAPADLKPQRETYLDLTHNIGSNVLVSSAPIGPHGECMVAIAPLKNRQWFFVYQQQQTEILADLYKGFMLVAGIVLLGIVGIASVGCILSSRMIGRIQTITQEKEIMNLQVVQAGKMAAVGELAAGIAHEINNPVAIMVEEAGWVEDLLEEEHLSNTDNEKEIRRALHEIAVQGKRSKDITHKLLSFARKTDACIQEVDIFELIEEILGVSKQRAKFAAVQVQTQIQPDLPHLQASPTEMQQVFLNLVNNALDAMEDMQGGQLTIQAFRRGDFVVVQVQDTGPGIPKHDLERVFEPFYTTKAVGKGTGLGLSICYGIVEKMGGHISVQSGLGVGTTFIVQLPITETEHGQEKKT